jgi:hypothetical protein
MGWGEILTPPEAVKPLKLSKYLAQLLLPPSAYAPRRLLVPFAGVASEVIGGMMAGFEDIVGIEREQEYCTIANKRIAYWQAQQAKQQPTLLEVA